MYLLIEDFKEEESRLFEDDDDSIDAVDSSPFGNFPEGPGFASGSTAVVALLKGNELYVANAGDSKCVVSRLGMFRANDKSRRYMFSALFKQ